MAVIGVVGLGVMGLGIAQVFAAAGNTVIAYDGHAPARETALTRLKSGLSLRVEAGKLTTADLEAIVSRFTIADTLQEMAGTELVIEAIAEQLEAKQQLFAKLETITTAVLATNTSSLSVASLATVLACPGRLLGLHFFNPAPAMKLVELVVTLETGAPAVEFARKLTEAAGKVVITCADTPGFIVNRCARPYYGEALAMLEEGRNPSEIDAAMVSAGYRLGPFALIDLIGADINLAASVGMRAAMGNHPRYHVFSTLSAQVSRGDLGRKSGKGFVYPNNSVNLPSDAVEIVQRIEAVLANEAATLLNEGGTDMASIDKALRMGLNFPRGPSAVVRSHGLPAILAMLETLEANAPAYLKGRYAPSPALQDLQ
ncbi:MAG: 3-hydroxyacyl-CoA dehydrogenase NAD-binding domain-containing protein [Paracoccaceae bacterium]